MGSRTEDKFRWISTAPAILACSLAAIYALGAISIFGQFLAADLDAVQTMPLVPIDQILARGIGAIIDQALLGLVAIGFALGISAIEDMREMRAKRLGKASTSPGLSAGAGSSTLGGWLGLVVPIAVLFGGFFLPFGLVTALGAGILVIQTVIPRARDALVRRGHRKWRPVAFLIGYGCFLVVSALVGGFSRPSPLPDATLTRKVGEPVHGSLVALNGSNWFLANSAGRITNVPESAVARATITYSDQVDDESLFQMLKD
jgi:hypothetical protein